MCRNVVLASPLLPKCRNEQADLEAIVRAMKTLLGQDICIGSYTASDMSKNRNAVTELRSRELEKLYDENKRLQKLISEQKEENDRSRMENDRQLQQANKRIESWKATALLCMSLLFVSVALHTRR